MVDPAGTKRESKCICDASRIELLSGLVCVPSRGLGRNVVDTSNLFVAEVHGSLSQDQKLARTQGTRLRFSVERMGGIAVVREVGESKPGGCLWAEPVLTAPKAVDGWAEFFENATHQNAPLRPGPDGVDGGARVLWAGDDQHPCLGEALTYLWKEGGD